MAVLGATAFADDAVDAAIRNAEQLLAAGDRAGAQKAFEAAADLDPTGPRADGALSAAAEQAYLRGDVVEELRLWRRYLGEHPSARRVKRARLRIAALERSIGAGGEWTEVAIEHERIVHDAVGVSDPTDHAEALSRLVADHPDYPRTHDARMWIGDTWLRVGQPRRAAAVFAEARERAVDREPRWYAGKAHGDALAAAGDLDGAERIYRSMFGEGDAIADRALREELEDLDKMRLRARLLLLAWGVLAVALVLFLAGTWWATGGAAAAARALIRPPVEVWYFAPVALVLIGVALTGNFLVERAVREILVGGLLITWLAGASADAARRAGKLRGEIVAAHVVAIAGAVAAVCYLAVMDDQLLEMIGETWSHGHEGR